MTDPSLSMRERIARAIYGPDDYPAVPWETANAGDREEAFAAADRVLEAMREPSEAMLAGAVPEPTHLYGVDGRDEKYQREMKHATTLERMVFWGKWLNAIDAAIREGKDANG